MLSSAVYKFLSLIRSFCLFLFLFSLLKEVGQKDDCSIQVVFILQVSSTLENLPLTSWENLGKLFKIPIPVSKFGFKKNLFSALCLSCGTGDLHCLMYDLCCSMWDLVPWPGIEPGPPALEARILSHWTTREVPKFGFFFFKDTTDKWDHTVYVFFCLIYFT